MHQGLKEIRINEFHPTHNWDLNPSRIIPNLFGSTDYIHPVSFWVIWYKVHVSFFEYIVTSLAISTLFRIICRRMTKSFTCSCDIFSFFNISRRVYWYCRVSRRYCVDRKHIVSLAILKNLARWVEFYPFSDLRSNSRYVDKWLLTLIMKYRRELHFFVVASLQLWLLIHSGSSLAPIEWETN